MKQIRSIIVATLAAAIGAYSAGNTYADIVIAEWTFETSVPATAGPHVAEGGVQAGVAAASGFRGMGTTTYNNPVGNGSVESFSSNNWTTVGDYYQFQFSLTGYHNATIQWDQTRSGTGPSDFDLQWSTDGINFTSILNYTVLQGTWSSGTFDPAFRFGPEALPSDVNNQSNVFVRLSSNVVAASSGTNRVDNIIVEARLIPEPTSAGLLALLMVAGGTIRRRI